MQNAYFRYIVQVCQLLGLCMLISACAGVHLHNPKMAQLARDTNEGFLQIGNDIDAEFKKQSENLSSLLAKELVEVERVSKNNRDAALAILVTSDETINTRLFGFSSKGADNKGIVRKRLDVIGLKGDTMADYAETLEKYSKFNEERSFRGYAIGQYVSVLKSTFRYPKSLNCSAEGVITPLDSEALKIAILGNLEQEDDTNPSVTFEAAKKVAVETYNKASKACSDLVQDYRQYFTAEGEFMVLLETLTDVVAEEQVAKATARKMREGFDSIKIELEEKLPNSPDKKPSDIIGDQFKQLQAILKGAGNLAKLSGDRVILEKRLAEVNELIANIASGGDDEESKDEADGDTTADATEATKQDDKLSRTKERVKLALAGLPNLMDSFSELRRIMDRPPLTALTMVKQELDARLQAVTAAHARAQARIDFVKEKHASLNQELSGYNAMFRLIKMAQKDGKDAKIGDVINYSFGNFMREKVPHGADPFKLARAKQAVKAALVLQTHVEARQLKNRFQAEYKTIALDYQASIEESKARMAQWYALIGPMLTRQQLYHQSGVRKDQVASLTVELLKVLALFNIAWEVN